MQRPAVRLRSDVVRVVVLDTHARELPLDAHTTPVVIDSSVLCVTTRIWGRSSGVAAINTHTFRKSTRRWLVGMCLKNVRQVPCHAGHLGVVEEPQDVVRARAPTLLQDDRRVDVDHPVERQAEGPLRKRPAVRRDRAGVRTVPPGSVIGSKHPSSEEHSPLVSPKYLLMVSHPSRRNRTP